MYVGKVKYGNNTWPVGSTLYGTCNTAAATVEKTVTLADFDTLLEGVTIHVKFTNSNSASNPTLNVNSTGAYAIKRYGTKATGTSAKSSWNAGSVVSFTYDGTYWQLNDWLNNDTTYTFDGTYDASTNKAATVNTVTNAINALDGGTIGTGGSGKTITSLSQTNGNVSATFGDISITKSQVSDFPSLATVATSGSYNDLSNKPTIPSAANNGTFSVKTKVGSNDAVTAADFTANQSSADDITFIQGSNVTLTTDTTNRTVTIAAKDTTYAFDGTYNSSTNKAATVSTVTNAIAALDGTVTGSAGSGKTITAFSQTDGKVSATFGDISITKSQVSDFPTIPTVNNAKFSVKGDGTEVASTTANASSASSVDIVAGSNVTITPDATNKKITIASTDTNTTYTFEGGTNKFTVTPSGGTAQSVTITPSISNNVTASGDFAANAIVVGNAANKVAKNSGVTISTTTPSSSSGDTTVPTSKAVWNAVANGIAANDAMVYKGTVAGGSTGNYGALTPAASKGETYKVTTAGKIDGITVEVGDMLICNTDSTAAATSSNYSTIVANWDFIQTNIDGAVTGPASSTSGNLASYNGTTGKVIKDSGLTTTNVSDAVSKKHSHSSLTLSTTALAYDGSHTLALPSSDPYSSARTPSSHTHGNILNNGTLQSNDITIASGDKLVVTDSSDSSKIARTSVSFDGSTTTKALTKKGTFETFATTNTTYAAGTGITITGTNNAINVTYGTTANTACQGNDNRLSNARPASDVYEWAKAATKPSYQWSEISNRYDLLLVFGGSGIAGDVSPIGMALSSEHSANRLAFVNPNAIDIEYSTNGTDFTTLSLTDELKTALCTSSQVVAVGRVDESSAATVGSKTRITISACKSTNNKDYYFYCNPRKMLIKVSTAHKMNVVIECRTGTNTLNNGPWETFGTYTLSGLSGWNDIPLLLRRLGGLTANYWQIRLTFTITELSTSSPTSLSANVLAIRLFSDRCWKRTSNMGETGHLYSYDTVQNATFPANLTAQHIFAKYLNLSSGSETPTKNSYIMYANSDGYLRKTTIANLATAVTNAGYNWTNTTYSAGTGLSLSGTTFSVKTGYTTSGNNRAVQADSNGNLYVTQKDDNATYTFTDNNPTLAWGTKSKVATVGGTDIHVTMPANPNTNTTYTIATGDSDGQIKVTPSIGSAYNVSVKGLGSRAYDSTSYLPLAGGTMSGDITMPTTKAFYGILGDFSTTTLSDVGGLSWKNLNGKQSSSVNVYDTPSTADTWWYILRNRHTNTDNNYYTDVAIPFGANGIYYKRINNGSIVNNTIKNGWIAVLDELNSSVSKSGETLTVKINGTSQSLTNTNTWRGITNDYNPATPSDSTSLSLTGAKNLYNQIPEVTLYTVVKLIARGSDFDPVQPGYFAGMTKSSGITSDWWHILSMDWSGNNSVNWISQLALPTQARNGVYYRSWNAGQDKKWVKLWDLDNLTNLNQLTNGPGYITGITKTMVTNALGYTPPTSDTNNAVTLTNTTTNASYRVLMSVTADDTTRTEGARKSTNLLFNPSAGKLSVSLSIQNTDNHDRSGGWNTYELGRGVSVYDSIGSSSTGAPSNYYCTALHVAGQYWFLLAFERGDNRLLYRGGNVDGATRNWSRIHTYGDNEYACFGKMWIQCSTDDSHVIIGALEKLDTTAGPWVGIGKVNPSYKLHVNGACGATSFPNTSDIRLKDILSEWLPKLEDIANAPSFLFKWNNIKDDTVHLGSSAQYWEEKAPNVVTEANDEIKTKSLQYDVLGTVNSIAIAKEVVSLKEEIKLLQALIAELKLLLNN